MHILVTNDDGVHAPGLLALAQAVEKLQTGSRFLHRIIIGLRQVMSKRSIGLSASKR